MSNEKIIIINQKQAMLYLKHGLECRCFYNNNKIVYEFDKKETKMLFDLWCKRELK